MIHSPHLRTSSARRWPYLGDVLQHDLVEQHGHGVEVAGEGVGADAESFERDRAAAGERIDDERPGAGLAAECFVCGLRQSAAGVEVLGDGRVVPVGEVGDEVEQREPELVEVGRIGRVERDPFRFRQTIPSHWPKLSVEAVSCSDVVL